MPIETLNPDADSAMPATVFPLEPGDRLTRAEFERRYAQMPHVKKAELIEGIVYMPSAVRLKKHANPHGLVVTWMGHYSAFTPCVILGDNSSARLDLDNMPQPDALLMIEPECGGQARISEDDYVELGPELVAEISASTASFDLHTKLAVYRRSGIREYIVWRVLDRALDWFVLREGDYVPLKADDHGILRSTVFPGLWLDRAALLGGQMARVLNVLDSGIATPEHSAFAQLLQSRAAH